jgi:UDP-N-acetylmuramoyl-L-alanine---L-glutamate ligase
MPTPPPRSWADLAGRPVGIWGWGIEGHLAQRLLSAGGGHPVIVDDVPTDPQVMALGGGGLDALTACEVVVKSPGVSRYRAEVALLERHGVQVAGGLGLWMEGVDRSRVLCVTGTKGKSTTVSIIGHLMAGLDQRCFVGGNLGIPPYDPAAPTDVDWWVIETSSYQVTDLWSGPPTVAVTSLHPDHLDWHGSPDRYYGDKLALGRLPGVRRTVANGADPLLRARAGALGADVEWITPGAGRAPRWVERLGLLGQHNVTNALIARACLVSMGVPGADDDGRLAEAAAGFRGLPARLRTVGVVDGVRFVDDGLSTNVLPTLAALAAFADARVALIVGGFDRGIDYGELGRALAARPVPTMVLTVPDVGAKIAAAIAEAGPGPLLRVEACADEGVAARRGWAWAGPGGVVLLSPAAPSYGRYHDYTERSAVFAAAVEDCR